jgi:hypothetical protein
MTSTPEYLISLAFLAFGCGLVAAMAWLERKPKAILDARMVPTTTLMFAGFIMALLATVHLVNLLGLHTGR